ncbi:serine/threonine-protein kinase [Abyssibacter sp.]|uniref:protein kinase domain-containing protein n=1 Tax=Abyssibacter sp. TaxID=2320200 RepID=UPI0025C4EDEF|nr:serine/threonine-protein kinase [Abyssibacter sp.]MCK5860140.1 serine/threonine protein kinase [Abyssibacter sp.]
MNESSAPSTPERIGPYRILRELGRGGMGRVFLAEQLEPHRQVALKVLSSAGHDLERRFRRETEVLASLEHPNIARLYEAGIATVGAVDVPYLAMAYVEGSTLAEHARGQALSPQQKLALIAKIARAVHFAHTRGVIHRDLKPANILVDRHGEPRVLDFGVARVVTEDSATRVTHAGEIIGTVPYMSWEQLLGDTAVADPRSDVYSLGVIAYELLTGSLPYDGLETGTLVSAIEKLSKSTPQRLSAQLPSARGDMDTLIHKALEQDANRRYQSAAEFADDIDRLLDRRPIQARPPSIGYVTGLFVRRHKITAGAALAVVLSLVVATAVSVRFAVSEAQARINAEERLAEREAVNDFLNQMLISADPEQSLGERLSVVDVLDVARAEFASDQTLAAGVRAQLGRTLGNTYVALGRYDVGIELLDLALSLAPDSAARDSLLLDKAESEVTAARLDDATQTLAALSVNATATQLIRADFTRGRIDLEAGRSDESVAELRAVYATARDRLGPDDDLTLGIGQQLMVALVRMGENDESLQVGIDVAQRLEARLGRDNPRTVVAWDGVALNYPDQAKFDEAIALLNDNLDIYKRVLGEEHPQTSMTRASLAAAYAIAERPKEGVDLVVRGHEALRAQLGDEAEVVRTLASLRAYVVSEAGDYAQAAEINRQLVAQGEAKPDGPEINDLVDFNNLGNNLRKLGETRAAIAVFERLIELAADKLSREHLHYALFAGNYASALRADGQTARAVDILEQSCATVAANLGETHPRAIAVCGNLEEARAQLSSG